MEQKISLGVNHYLDHLLFTASKSKMIRRRIYGSWIITVGIFVAGSIFLYSRYDNASAYYCLAIAMICAVFYPMYSKWRYENYYLKYIKENYKNNIDLLFNIEITSDYLLISDATGESKTRLTELDEINETNNYIFIKLKNTQSVIIPKVQLRGDRFIDELEETTKRLDIKIHKDLNWKWK